MKTKKEIKEALTNLETKPQTTGWGAGGVDVSNYIIALKWVLDENKK